MRDGLGPLFNARSCAACHLRDGRGLPPSEPDEPFLGLLLRISVPGAGEHGEPLDPHPAYGGQLNHFALPDVIAEGEPRLTYEEVPGAFEDGTPYTLLRPSYTIEGLTGGPLGEETMISPRIAPQVIGLGLLEAIPTQRLEQLADPEDADGDGISGRLNRVWDHETGQVRPGRFGWKAGQPTVRQQVAAAFLGDIGITSPMFPDESCATGAAARCAPRPSTGGEPRDRGLENFERTVLYTSLLAVPARRRPDDPEVLRGARALHRMQAAGAAMWPRNITPRAKPSSSRSTDQKHLALHRSAPPRYGRGPRRRSPRLRGHRERVAHPRRCGGLGLVEAVNGELRLMHDGRARGFAEAILWHGGEAEASRAPSSRCRAPRAR